MNAHMIDSKNISIVCNQGKKNLKSRFINMSYCMTMVEPTTTPIMTPIRQEANTSSSAS